MQHQKVAGFITEFGGPLSHTAILARNLGIPAIVGVSEINQHLQTGDQLIIDGQEGIVYINPDKASLAHFRSLIRSENRRKTELKTLKNKPTITLDKKVITLQANIDRPDDIKQIKKYDDTGVGLFRTEMLFIDQNQWPSEQQQFKYYRSTLTKLKGKPLTIRTSDLGADKELQETIDHGPMAHNPAMGLRAIRRCLKEPDLLIPQVRAILRSSAFGPVLMMIPMLTNIEELDEVMQHVAHCKQQLRDSNIKFDDNIAIGAMIEVPAAALAAQAFASRLDFLSIGTNDLIQYTLALDRVDDEVNHLFNPLHPSVLQLIQITIQAGKQAGIPVSLCGEMASDPKYTRLLLGMGLNYFSVQPNALLEIKHVINHSKLNSLRPRVRKILQCDSAQEIEALVVRLNH
jgi:phosphotransferase system enzyme I (PtsI)